MIASPVYLLSVIVAFPFFCLVTEVPGWFSIILFFAVFLSSYVLGLAILVMYGRDPPDLRLREVIESAIIIMTLWPCVVGLTLALTPGSGNISYSVCGLLILSASSLLSLKLYWEAKKLDESIRSIKLDTISLGDAFAAVYGLNALRKLIEESGFLTQNDLKLLQPVGRAIRFFSKFDERLSDYWRRLVRSLYASLFLKETEGSGERDKDLESIALLAGVISRRISIILKRILSQALSHRKKT